MFRKCQFSENSWKREILLKNYQRHFLNNSLKSSFILSIVNIAWKGLYIVEKLN